LLSSRIVWKSPRPAASRQLGEAGCTCTSARAGTPFRGSGSSSLTGLNLRPSTAPHRGESTPLEFCKLPAEDNGQGLGESEARELLPTRAGTVRVSLVVVSSSDMYGGALQGRYASAAVKSSAKRQTGYVPLSLIPIVRAAEYNALVSAVAEVACRFDCKPARIETHWC
jgi:hypothetical protein